jgi:diadenylate cyclase
MSFINILIIVVEVGIITILVNYLLSFFWNTRAMDVVIGFLAFLLIFAAASWLHLPVLQKILLYVVEVLVVAVLVIFQPELRLALARVSVRGRKFREMTEFDQFLEDLSTSVYHMAEQGIGAIIVLENSDSLEEFSQRAITLNADFSPELLETIFAPVTPLHDGAIILRERTILGASCVLPLAEDTSHIARSMGTRHRAGLGISQLTDALAIII